LAPMTESKLDKCLERYLIRMMASRLEMRLEPHSVPMTASKLDKCLEPYLGLTKVSLLEMRLEPHLELMTAPRFAIHLELLSSLGNHLLLMMGSRKAEMMD